MTETIFFPCDACLISRAIGRLALNYRDKNIFLSISDNGAGMSAEKLKELSVKPHYMESTNDRLDLRHGLGLILVHQIVNAHKGTMRIESKEQEGCKIVLDFPIEDDNLD